MSKADPWLAAIIEHRHPMQPVATDVVPRLKPMSSIKAVVFDVYGTLVTSGSGDVGAAVDLPSLVDSSVENSAADPMREALATLDRAARETLDPDRISTGTFRDLIGATNDQSRSGGIACPEVDIVDVWRNYLASIGAGELAMDVESVVRLATAYEARANPTWPMPSAHQVLDSLRQAEIPMGIVSNAQVFTPVIVKNLTQKSSLAEAGFVLDWCLFSNRFRQSKPGPRLFDVLVKALARSNVTPQEAIYVGNDMLNDVYAASVAGLATAWFAGDHRSCRPRRDDQRVAGLEPDLVITKLPQLLECLSIN